MERRFAIWEVIIKSMDLISRISQKKEVGILQIVSQFKKMDKELCGIIEPSKITHDEIFLALTGDSDCVELFQLEYATKTDIYFSLRGSAETCLLKAKKLMTHGIKQILNQKYGKNKDFWLHTQNENENFQQNFYCFNY